MTNNEIVQKLWNLCDVLRDDGINYNQYLTELVMLLFIKMTHEKELIKSDDGRNPIEHLLPKTLADAPGKRCSMITKRCY